MRVKALVIRLDSWNVEEVEPTLNALKGILDGGWLEAIGGEGWHAYIDEEGKLKQLPVNEPATYLAFMCGWRAHDYLCGTAIFLGNGDDGQEADVPAPILRVWAHLSEERKPPTRE